MTDFQIPDFTTLPDHEVQEIYLAVSAEITRRHELTRIPGQIATLAQQGREIGVEEATMIDAVTNSIGHPPEIDEPQA